MKVEQLKLKLDEIALAQTHLDRALLEDAVDFIYSKVGAKKPTKASLHELIDSPVGLVI